MHKANLTPAARLEEMVTRYQTTAPQLTAWLEENVQKRCRCIALAEAEAALAPPTSAGVKPSWRPGPGDEPRRFVEAPRR